MIAPFVDPSALEKDDVVVADVRYYLDGRSGRAAYESGHIPGAVFVDLERDLTGHGVAGGGRHPLPDPEHFQAALAGLGIADGDTVIAYDDAGGVMAARLVWMLRVTGREAALLDGGIQAWPHALSTEIVERPAAEPAVRPWPVERLATIDDAAGAAARGIVLLDARPRERFAGAPDALDPRAGHIPGVPDALDPRAGHIPGARSVPCRENLDSSGRLLPVAELRDRFGVDDGAGVISYCGSGVTACHNLLAMEHAGLGAGRLFPGSWSQWSRDPTRPVAVGGQYPKT